MAAPTYASESIADSTDVTATWVEDSMKMRTRQRGLPNWFNQHGYSLDADERLANIIKPFKAAKEAEGESTFYLLTIPPELRAWILERLTENVHVIGITTKSTDNCPKVTFIHPLLYIKELRKPFYDTVMSERKYKVTKYVALVPNFNFAEITDILNKNQLFGQGLQRIDFHILHDITSAEIKHTKLRKWAGKNAFAESHRQRLLVRHDIHSMPEPGARDEFLDSLIFMDAEYLKVPEINRIVSAFQDWWNDGEGVNGCIAEDDAGSDLCTPESGDEEDYPSSIGVELDDSKDGLMDYDWTLPKNVGLSTAINGDTYMEDDDELELDIIYRSLESRDDDDDDEIHDDEMDDSDEMDEDDELDDDSSSGSSDYCDLDDEETKEGLEENRDYGAAMLGVQRRRPEWEDVALSDQNPLEQLKHRVQVWRPVMTLMREKYRPRT